MTLRLAPVGAVLLPDVFSFYYIILVAKRMLKYIHICVCRSLKSYKECQATSKCVTSLAISLFSSLLFSFFRFSTYLLFCSWRLTPPIDSAEQMIISPCRRCLNELLRKDKLGEKLSSLYAFSSSDPASFSRSRET